MVTGDSITEKNFRAGKNWHDYLKEDLGFARVINDGKSGTGLTRLYSSYPSIYERIDSWPAADLILVMASLNDGGGNNAGLPLGALGDEGPGISYYGDCKAVIEKIIGLFPLTPLGFISPPPRGSVQDRGPTYGTGAWYRPWNRALKEVCAAYCVPCFDLFQNSGLRPHLPQHNAKYFSCSATPQGDLVHPNDLGQKIMADKIRPFLEMYF